MKSAISLIFILISLMLCEGHCSSIEKDILDNFLDSCEKYSESDYLYQYCQAYLAPKAEVQKQGDRVVNRVKKSVNPEVMSVSAFVFKTAYEGRVSFKVKTEFGTPTLSISPDKTIFNWTKDF